MKIEVMIPLDDAAMADGMLWPMGWYADGGGVFGIQFPELDDRHIPRLAEDAASRAQKEIEEFHAVGHERMVIETRSEAVLERVREMVRDRKDLEASVYTVRGFERGLEEARYDILPDGSIEPPLVFGRVSSTAPRDPMPLPYTAEKGVGFEPARVDHHGELELILKVKDAKGSAWLSREMWVRLGEVAGWRFVPGEDLRQTINEGIEITHDQSVKIEQLEKDKSAIAAAARKLLMLLSKMQIGDLVRTVRSKHPAAALVGELTNAMHALAAAIDVED